MLNRAKNRRKVKEKENINLRNDLILEQGNHWQFENNFSRAVMMESSWQIKATGEWRENKSIINPWRNENKFSSLCSQGMSQSLALSGNTRSIC